MAAPCRTTSTPTRSRAWPPPPRRSACTSFRGTTASRWAAWASPACRRCLPLSATRSSRPRASASATCPSAISSRPEPRTAGRRGLALTPPASPSSLLAEKIAFRARTLASSEEARAEMVRGPGALHSDPNALPVERPHRREPQQHIADRPREGGRCRLQPRRQEMFVQHGLERARLAAIRHVHARERDGEKRGEEEHGEGIDAKDDERRCPPREVLDLDQPEAGGEHQERRARREDRVRAGPQRLVDGEVPPPCETDHDAGTAAPREALDGRRRRGRRQHKPAREDAEEGGGDSGQCAEDSLGIVDAAKTPDVRTQQRPVDPGRKVTLLAEIARAEARHGDEGQQRPVADQRGGG